MISRCTGVYFWNKPDIEDWIRDNAGFVTPVQSTDRTVFKIGMSMDELAAEVPVSPQTFRSWRLKQRRVPAERVIRYCELTGENLWEVRPDIYPVSGAGPVQEYAVHLTGSG